MCQYWHMIPFFYHNSPKDDGFSEHTERRKTEMKNHFRKGAFRWASLILIAVMAINLLPLTAMAEGTDPWDWSSGSGSSDDPFVGLISSQEDLDAAEAKINDNDVNNSGKYYTVSLQADIACTNSFNVSRNNITLLGNGHTLDFSNINNAMNITGQDTVLSLGDSNSSGTPSRLTIIGNPERNGDPFICVSSYASGKDYGTLKMYDGVTITGAVGDTTFGGAVTVGSAGYFEMNGGTIQNCGIRSGSVCYGGGVAVINGGSFVMNGGTIQNCFLKQSYSHPTEDYNVFFNYCAGAGVFVNNRSYFKMTGGEIKNNEISTNAGVGAYGVGGGIAIIGDRSSYAVGSRVDITGGRITGNKATFGGGGIAICGLRPMASALANPDDRYADELANPGLYISGGTIADNHADGNSDYGFGGGGILIYHLNYRNTYSNNVNIKNARITGNTVGNGPGGGIANLHLSSGYQNDITIENCNIQNNSALRGGGICMCNATNTSKMNTAVSGSILTGNAASGDLGGGISVDGNGEDKTTLQFDPDCAIYDNTAETGADDIYKDANSAMVALPTADEMNDAVSELNLAGWYLDPVGNRYSSSNAVAYTPISSENAQQYLKAVKISNYTVTFDSQGGSAVDSQFVRPSERAFEPTAPIRDGYVFVGWYKEALCTNAYSFTTPVTQNTTLYAKWIDASTAYTVTFDSKGGSAVESQAVSGGGKAAEPADPGFTDHVFTGWYTDEGCTIPYDFDTLLSSDITLYAGWKQLKYTMHYGDDRENDETWGYNYAEGQNGYYVPSVAKPLPSEVRHFTVEEIADSSFDSSQYPGLDVAKPGYYFIAWFASVPVTKAQVDENFPVYTDAARTSEIAHNALADGTTYYQYLPFTQTPDRDLGDVHFYAQWMLISIDIDVQVNVQIIVDKNLNFSHLLTSGANVNKIVMIEEDQKSALAKNITPNDVKGTNCKIELVATVADAVNQDEIEATDAYITEHYLGYDKLSYDVAITKKISVNGSLYSEANLKGLAQSIEIEFAVPDEWQNGTVKLLRAHTDEGGVITVEECADLLPGNRQIYKISSDSFSSYSMIYSGSGGSSGGGGSGGGTSAYTLRYQSNGGTSCPDETKTSAWSKDYDSLPVPVREGYLFTGWFADSGLQTPISEDVQVNRRLVTIYAGWEKSMVPAMLNGDDHYAYVQGYSDGTVRPNDNITRAEVATIFFRLLKDEIREENLSDVNTFEDVTDGMWCNKAISTMAVLGVVKGRTAECFDPDAPITRGEFAAICSRFDKSDIVARENFTDIEGYWAKEEIERAAVLGWVRGYTDGSFRPRNYITRAEAMTMINRVLHRVPESPEDLLPDMVTWPDNKLTDWYYLAVQEATNSHIPERKANGYESWSALTYNRDWSIYQS